MFDFTDIIYYILLLSAIILSLIAPKDHFRGLIYLRILLIVGFCSELSVDLINSNYKAVHAPPSPIHYFYIPFEYIMLSVFLKKYLKVKLVKTLINFSFIIYVLVALYFSIFYYSFGKDYPGIIYNFGIGFLIIWSSLLLFNLEFNKKVKLIQLPIFWICTAIIILYSGVFFYNGVYNYLVDARTELAYKLRRNINLNLNFIFYILLCYSFICSIRHKKSAKSSTL